VVEQRLEMLKMDKDLIVALGEETQIESVKVLIKDLSRRS
jgi:hypothetical protein